MQKLLQANTTQKCCCTFLSLTHVVKIIFSFGPARLLTQLFTMIRSATFSATLLYTVRLQKL